MKFLMGSAIVFASWLFSIGFNGSSIPTPKHSVGPCATASDPIATHYYRHLGEFLSRTDTVATSIRTGLGLPAGGATVAVVNDTIVCRAIRRVQDSLLTGGFNAGAPGTDTTRALLITAMDSMYVVADFAVPQNRFPYSFVIFSPTLRRVGGWK